MRVTEAAGAAGGASEFTDDARLGEHGKTSRRSQAIFRLPLFSPAQRSGEP